MNASTCNVTTYLWLDQDSIGSPICHDRTLVLFRDSVIRPSLRVLEAEIDNLRNSDDEIVAAFFAEDLADLFHSTVEGYLLTAQSMWERGLRGLLILRDKKICGGANVAGLERATWGGKSPTLQDHFQRLVGLSLQSFDSYADLDLLQNFGNAIRHGDGSAARRIHKLCPSLWSNWMSPGEEIFVGSIRVAMPIDGPAHPTFDSVTLPEKVMEQMIQSVLWFWEDIENMRCNSFKRKAPSVVDRLERWKEEKLSRESNRVWMPK